MPLRKYGIKDEGKRISFPKTLVVSIAVGIVIAVVGWSIMKTATAPETFATKQALASAVEDVKLDHNKDINNINTRILENHKALNDKMDLINNNLNCLDSRITKQLDKIDKKLEKR